MIRIEIIQAFFFVLLLAGCSGGSGLAGDGAADGDAADAVDVPDARDDPVGDIGDSASPDLADTVDAPDGICEQEYYWQLQPRLVHSAELVDGPSSRLGVTERLMVEVQLQSGCEELGRLDVNIMQGDATDFVSLEASAWVPVGLDCTPSAPLVTWIAHIEGRQHGNLMAVVADGNVTDDGLLLSYGREACSGMPDCQCFAGTPPGPGEEWSSCLTDCSCGSGLSCVGYYGVAGRLWSCVQPCNDFLDCDSREECLPPIPDGCPYVCEPQNEQDLCDSEDDCPEGFYCVISEHGRYCVDRREYPAVKPCGCDEECPAGQRCILSFRDTPTCEVPCLRNEDCPNPPETDVFVCAIPAICMPLE